MPPRGGGAPKRRLRHWASRKMPDGYRSLTGGNRQYLLYVMVYYMDRRLCADYSGAANLA